MLLHMKRKIITLASTKGGVGKSTVTASLAWELHLRGYRVVVVDTDPQGSMLDWADQGDDEGPLVVGMGDNLAKDLPRLVRDYDVALVDTGARAGTRMGRAMALAHLVVVPTGAGPTDVWAVGQTLEVVERARSVRLDDGPMVLILPNAIDMRTSLGRQLEGLLEEAKEPISANAQGARVAFVEAVGAGIGVTSYEPKSRAAEEMRGLVSEVEAILGLTSEEDDGE